MNYKELVLEMYPNMVLNQRPYTFFKNTNKYVFIMLQDSKTNHILKCNYYNVNKTEMVWKDTWELIQYMVEGKLCQ